MLVFAGLLLCLSAGCEPRPTPVEPRLDLEAAIPPLSPEEQALATVDSEWVIRAGSLELSLADYQLAIARLKLLGMVPTEQQLADAGFQEATALRALRVVALRQVAKERELSPQASDLLAAMQRHPKLPQVEPAELEAKLDELALASGVDRADVRRVVEDEALERLVLESLREVPDEALLWEQFQAEKRTVSIELVRFLNVPSSLELDEVVRQRPSEIEAYYRGRWQRYHQPPKVELRRLLLPLPESASAQAQTEATRRAQALLERARAGEDFISLIRQHSEDPARATKDGLMPPVESSRIVEMQGLEVGELFLRRDAAGVAVLRVERELAAIERPLDESLQREIGSLLLQAEGMLPSVARTAREAARALLDGDQTTLSRLLQAHPSDRFSLQELELPSGKLLPGVGQLPRVRDALERLEQPAAVSEPVLDGEHVYVVQLLARNTPSRARFDDEKQSYREYLRRREEAQLFDALLSRYTTAQMSLRLRPVQRVYGVLKKDGTVMKLTEGRANVAP